MGPYKVGLDGMERTWNIQSKIWMTLGWRVNGTLVVVGGKGQEKARVSRAGHGLREKRDDGSGQGRAGRGGSWQGRAGQVRAGQETRGNGGKGGAEGEGVRPKGGRGGEGWGGVGWNGVRRDGLG